MSFARSWATDVCLSIFFVCRWIKFSQTVRKIEPALLFIWRKTFRRWIFSPRDQTRITAAAAALERVRVTCECLWKILELRMATGTSTFSVEKKMLFVLVLLMKKLFTRIKWGCIVFFCTTVVKEQPCKLELWMHIWNTYFKKFLIIHIMIYKLYQKIMRFYKTMRGWITRRNFIKDDRDRAAQFSVRALKS